MTDISEANGKAFVDTHCHVDLYKEPLLLSNAIKQAGIYTIAVTNAPSVFSFTQNLAQDNSYLLPAIGLHPQLVRERHQEVSMLLSLIEKTDYVGEIGLDYITTDKAERKLQQSVFNQILEKCAGCGNKILTVHSRRAASDVIDQIGPAFPGIAILHWFSGSEKELDRALSNGLYFSINPAMVITQKGKSLISRIPREKLLTETDGPFVEHNAQQLEPHHVSLVIDYLSNLWECSSDEARDIVLENFLRIKNKN